MYTHSSGSRRLRVTTITKRFSDESLEDFKAGFDQEAACVSLARQCVEKADKEEPLDILKWIDRTLIRFIQRFSNYRKEDALSFKLPKELSLFP
jgi:protein transport protein SEC23